jgi:hypothetical protein
MNESVTPRDIEGSIQREETAARTFPAAEKHSRVTSGLEILPDRMADESCPAGDADDHEMRWLG